MCLYKVHRDYGLHLWMLIGFSIFPSMFFELLLLFSITNSKKEHVHIQHKNLNIMYNSKTKVFNIAKLPKVQG